MLLLFNNDESFLNLFSLKKKYEHFPEDKKNVDCDISI